MSVTHPPASVNDAFFQPLCGLAAASKHTRSCPEFADADFLHLGIQRVLELSASGRAFLQEQGVRFEHTPGHSNYFAALHSPRRRDVLRDVHRALAAHMRAPLQDRLGGLPELAGYEIFATDGHWHQAATHDARHDGRKMAVGHFYSLNLRTHTLAHLAAGEGLHEHDITALKRITPRGLRQGVPRGTRVLLIHDKAVVDFDFWKRCRHECALYVISRVKENMVYEWTSSRLWNRADPRNHGVTADRRVTTRQGHALRIICYTDPVNGQSYEFLTNEMDLPPGVIVELYRRRWEAEKVFDEIKNKLGEKKAWATSLVAREAQALLITITHNLLVRYEQELEREHGVTNEAEDRRRTKRMEAAGRTCEKKGTPLTSLVLCARRATQRSVKFVRWLRHSIRDRVAEATAVPRLRASYASL
jgi:hypothetical protein